MSVLNNQIGKNRIFFLVKEEEEEEEGNAGKMAWGFQFHVHDYNRVDSVFHGHILHWEMAHILKRILVKWGHLSNHRDAEVDA